MAFAGLFAPGEVILTPSVPREPTRDLADLGDGIFNRTWMMLDAPCLHLPLTTGPNGMPLGLQLVAPDRDEDSLLATARWMAEVLELPLTG
jgi:Asp-tRNA(Asn)/Glu-tRNA(Gln) amidotransferase A subunit family amidase